LYNLLGLLDIGLTPLLIS